MYIFYVYHHIFETFMINNTTLRMLLRLLPFSCGKGCKASTMQSITRAYTSLMEYLVGEHKFTQVFGNSFREYISTVVTGRMNFEMVIVNQIVFLCKQLKA